MDRSSRQDERAQYYPEKQGKRRHEWNAMSSAGLLLLASAVLLILIAVVVYQLLHSELIFRGVSVGGVPVGGMTREMALAKLRPLFDARSNRPVTLRLDDRERKVTLAEMGISYDAAAAVEAAFQVGRSGSIHERLSVQIEALTQSINVDAFGAKLDKMKLESFLVSQALEIDRSVRDAELVVGNDLSVRVMPEVIGRRLDTASAVTAIQQGLMADSDLIELPVLKTLPKMVTKDLEDARTKLERIYAGPVSLEFDGRLWTIGLQEIAVLVTLDQRPGNTSPTISIQEAPLKELLDRIAGEMDQIKVDGRYDWNGGNLKAIQQGKDGRKLDKAEALEAIRSALWSDQKTVALPVEVDKAIGDSIGAAQLKIKERIDFGQTTISGVPEKVHNIKLAASRLHGIVLRPGEVFSFNKALGPTTLKAGFQVGFGIAVNNGEMQTVPSVAGGICQVSTTLLHAVFWSGLQVEERYPHMYWIASYGQPPRGITGLDTTVDPPALDFQFVNNTDNYLLIQSSTADSQLVFELYGTKPDWEVQVEGPVITNTVKSDPKEVRQEEPSWPEGRELWVERATDGFDVVIVRRVIQGQNTRTLELKSQYQPSRNVILVGSKKPDSESVAGATHGTAPSATPSPTSPASPGGERLPLTPTPSPGH